MVENPHFLGVSGHTLQEIIVKLYQFSSDKGPITAQIWTISLLKMYSCNNLPRNLLYNPMALNSLKGIEGILWLFLAKIFQYNN